jgi:hypothetical protein
MIRDSLVPTARFHEGLGARRIHARRHPRHFATHFEFRDGCANSTAGTQPSEWKHRKARGVKEPLSVRE